MLVREEGVGDAGQADADAVVGGAFAFDDFVGVIANAVFDGGHLVVVEEVFDRLHADAAEAPRNKAGVAVFADDVGFDVFGVDFGLVADGVFEARAVEDGAGADDFGVGQAGVFPSQLGHDVEGVGDHEQDAVKAAGHDFGNHRLEDGGVFLDQIHAGFAGRLRGASGDDDELGALAIRIFTEADLHITRRVAERRVEVEGFAGGFGAGAVDEKELVNFGALIKQGKGVAHTNVARTDDYHPFHSPIIA